MNARAGIKVDKATFYRFIERQAEGHFEFDRGSIVQHMTGGTFDHAQIITDLVVTLRALLSRQDWAVSTQSRGVDTGNTVRYPDVVVEPAGSARKTLSTEAPVLIFEVLSPTTAELDLNTKPAEYTGLASLLAYVVVSQDVTELTVWQRTGDGKFPDAPASIRGPDAMLELNALGISISLASIYASIG